MNRLNVKQAENQYQFMNQFYDVMCAKAQGSGVVL